MPFKNFKVSFHRGIFDRFVRNARKEAAAPAGATAAAGGAPAARASSTTRSRTRWPMLIERVRDEGPGPTTTEPTDIPP